MDDVTLKGVGFWLLTVLEAIVVFIAFMLGKWSNGLSPEFATLIGTILIATQVLLVLFIRKYFKTDL